jgi:hypothetical protein
MSAFEHIDQGFGMPYEMKYEASVHDPLYDDNWTQIKPEI